MQWDCMVQNGNLAIEGVKKWKVSSDVSQMYTNGETGTEIPEQEVATN